MLMNTISVISALPSDAPQQTDAPFSDWQAAKKYYCLVLCVSTPVSRFEVTDWRSLSDRGHKNRKRRSWNINWTADSVKADSSDSEV